MIADEEQGSSCGPRRPVGLPGGAQGEGSVGAGAASGITATGQDASWRTGLPRAAVPVVWRICRDNAWWSVFGKPRARKGSMPGSPADDDLVRRHFTATGPNQSVRMWKDEPRPAHLSAAA